MCAINGILTLKPEPETGLLVGSMNREVIHRGPDDGGIISWKDKVFMGMRRLSIIDLVKGAQPMTDTSGNYSIVFNGELYNHKSLRRELQFLGYVFRTHSDTEVLLNMYAHFKMDMFAKLRGMFAFSILDRERSELIIARDRFGEKPLYYSASNSSVIWSSELKSIIKVKPQLKNISRYSLNLYLRLSYIPAPYTIYEDIKKLKPGCLLRIDTNTLSVQEEQYYSSQLKKTEEQSRLREPNQELKNRLYERVEECMISDVPLGVFLSGGVDSSIIAAIMSRISSRKINTFTVGFENKRYDESDRARQVAKHLHTVHHASVLNYEKVFSHLDQIILNFDEPFADSSMIPTWYVSKHASAYVKVALTGDGADELFGGYNKYLMLSYGKWFQQLTPSILYKPLHAWVNSPGYKTRDTRSFNKRLKKMVNASGSDFMGNHLAIMSMGFDQHELEQLLQEPHTTALSEYIPPHEEGTDPLKLLRNIDLNLSLEGDMLVKTDRVSMLCSLECRAPFLDQGIAQLADSLPDDHLIRGRQKKRVLTETFKDHLPPGFFNSPKRGFEVPIGDWFRKELKTELSKALSEEACQAHNLFHYPFVRKLLDQHLHRGIDHSSRLWTLFCFQKWYTRSYLTNGDQ